MANDVDPILLVILRDAIAKGYEVALSVLVGGVWITGSVVGELSARAALGRQLIGVDVDVPDDGSVMHLKDATATGRLGGPTFIRVNLSSIDAWTLAS